MIIDDKTARDLHSMGVRDHVATYFRVTGPYSIAVNDSDEIIFTDFLGGRCDIHLSTTSELSKLEIERSYGSYALSRLYYYRGQESGEQIMRMLIEAAAFQQRVRYSWWYRLGCVLGRIMRAASYRLGRFYRFLFDKWKSVVYPWVYKHTRDPRRPRLAHPPPPCLTENNDADEHGNTFHP